MDKPNNSLNSDDLKSIEDWIDYYCILYNKSRKKKYLDKVTDLINRLKDTEKIVLLNRREGFEEAFGKALERRILKDMQEEGNVYMEATEAGLKILNSKELTDEYLKQIKKEKEDGSK